MKHIVVLMGGEASESEVSMLTGEAVHEALIELGYKASKLIFSSNFVSDLKKLKPDAVFNAMHGKYGEDGSVPGCLDILKIPYTHSGLKSSAIGMDKILTKQICIESGIKTAKFEILYKNDDKKNQDKIDRIGKPFVVKPVNEGSSNGVEIVLEGNDFDIRNYNWKYGSSLIVEEYIKGKEIQVGIIGNEAIGALEVVPGNLFFDYESKYTSGKSQYIMPARISDEQYQKALFVGYKCHKILGCKSISRVEFILGDDGELYLLEINTHPGFTKNSIIPKIAAHKGIEFKQIVHYLLKNASYN